MDIKQRQNHTALSKTIFQKKALRNEGERAAAAIWVQLGAKAEPESLFLLDTNLTILSHPSAEEF